MYSIFRHAGKINIIYPVGIGHAYRIKSVRIDDELSIYGVYQYEDDFVSPNTMCFVQQIFVANDNVARQFTTSTQVTGTYGAYKLNIAFIKQDGNFLTAGTRVKFDLLMINAD